MKKNIWKILYIIIICGVSFSILLSTKVFATDDNQVPATGFTYQLNYPDNQLDSSLNYFSLMMKPSQEEKISLDLSNPSPSPIEISLNLNGAKTNSNGTIEWTNNLIKNDDSLQIPFEDIVSGPDSVELAGGETKNVTFTIKMPEKNLKVLLLEDYN